MPLRLWLPKCPLQDYNMPMNTLFLEGPIQTGKSTLIRKILREVFDQDLSGVAGFTSQRITDSDGNLLGFRLAPAASDLSVTADSVGTDNVFKYFTPSGSKTDMSVFETTGIELINEAYAAVKEGRAKVVLLDEIGGHELASSAFRNELYKLLDSDVPCIGVVKSQSNTKHMDPTLLMLNKELHNKLTVVTEFDEFESSLRFFLNQFIL